MGGFVGSMVKGGVVVLAVDVSRYVYPFSSILWHRYTPFYWLDKNGRSIAGLTARFDLISRGCISPHQATTTTACHLLLLLQFNCQTTDSKIQVSKTNMNIPKNDTDWTTYINTFKSNLPPTPRNPSVVTKPTNINRTIDHTLLSESATEEQVDILCAEAAQWHFASVCVRLRHVAHAAQYLKDHPDVVAACVVSFPSGMDATAEKTIEAREAVALGATELDMVMKYPLLKEGMYTAAYEDVRAVREAAPLPVKLKVILETSQLEPGEVLAGALIAALAGADFVKTSTGFKGEGAKVEDVELMRAVVDAVGKGARVKASGGVRTAEEAVKMLRAGADRIGASSGVRIMEQVQGGSPVGGEAGSSGY